MCHHCRCRVVVAFLPDSESAVCANSMMSPLYSGRAITMNSNVIRHRGAGHQSSPIIATSVVRKTWIQNCPGIKHCGLPGGFVIIGSRDHTTMTGNWDGAPFSILPPRPNIPPEESWPQSFAQSTQKCSALQCRQFPHTH